MTNKTQEGRDPIAKQVESVPGTNSSRGVGSIEELISTLDSTHLDNPKSIIVTENSAKISAVTLPSPPVTPSASEQVSPALPLSPSPTLKTKTLSERLESKGKVQKWPAEKGLEDWFSRGSKFRGRPLTQEDRQHLYAFTRPPISPDVEVNIRVGTLKIGADTRGDSPLVAKHVLFSGQEFDELTSCYGPAVKESIRKAIKDYFEYYICTQDERMNHSMPSEKSEIANKYIEFPREGIIYLTAVDKDRWQVTSDSVLVKIGCTGDLNQRKKDYEKDAKLGCCITIPGSGNCPPVRFPFLLESILQQIFTYHQVDIRCHCSVKHKEIFRFDRLPGESVEEAFSEAEKTVNLHIDKWVEALSTLTELHEAIRKLQERIPQPSRIRIVKLGPVG
ncbi:hypothetical protein BGZ98_004462 [Dissophora globulifera]|nr:hypothetical protein BGZ98_004462 [Dissophora globulifera]